MKNLIRFVLTVTGIALGPGIVAAVFSLLNSVGVGDMYTELLPWVTIGIFVVAAIISLIIFLIFMPRMIDGIMHFTTDVEDGVSKMSGSKLLFASVGFITGLIVAWMISWPINNIPIVWLSVPLCIIIYIVCIYLFIRIFTKNATRMMNAFKEMYHNRKNKNNSTTYEGDIFGAKVIDTSAIIDGRIFDICKTGIVEGTLVIPEFVLGELRHIADSADNLKRGKGRRGLDIINKMQAELSVPIEITDMDFDDVPEVDAKLLRLAKELGGMVITTDFNLNKVAAVQGVKVFNINDLQNAIKPLLLPGEELSVTVVSEGKEQGQGLAYLEDGTMIVVEDGRQYIGKSIKVVVTSVLQTSAGRMIFARP